MLLSFIKIRVYQARGMELDTPPLCYNTTEKFLLRVKLNYIQTMNFEMPIAIRLTNQYAMLLRVHN